MPAEEKNGIEIIYFKDWIYFVVLKRTTVE
jgi:hypothetical protein